MRRELAHRRDSQLEVSLTWVPEGNYVVLAVSDTERDYVLEVPNDQALQAFYHPYAYIETASLLKGREQ